MTSNLSAVPGQVVANVFWFGRREYALVRLAGKERLVQQTVIIEQNVRQGIGLLCKPLWLEINFIERDYIGVGSLREAEGLGKAPKSNYYLYTTLEMHADLEGRVNWSQRSVLATGRKLIDKLPQALARRAFAHLPVSSACQERSGSGLLVEPDRFLYMLSSGLETAEELTRLSLGCFLINVLEFALRFPSRPGRVSIADFLCPSEYLKLAECAWDEGSAESQIWPFLDSLSEKINWLVRARIN